MHYEIQESGGDFRLYENGNDVGRACGAELQFWRENVKLREALAALVTTYAERDSGTFGPEEPLWEAARQAIGR